MAIDATRAEAAKEGVEEAFSVEIKHETAGVDIIRWAPLRSPPPSFSLYTLCLREPTRSEGKDLWKDIDVRPLDDLGPPTTNEMDALCT